MPTFPVAGANRTGPRGLALWMPVALYAAVIFVSSSIERPPAPPGGLPDYVVHALVYAGFAAVLLRALARGRWSGVTAGRAVAAAMAATAYGVTDEFHQSFVPGRFVSLGDLVADAGGAAAGVCAVLIAARVSWIRRPGASRSSP